MEIRPLDVMLLHQEAMQLELCCECYFRECMDCPANETKEKFKQLIKELSERKEGPAVNNPCYKCKERDPGCHSHCDRYHEWKKEYERIKNKRKEFIDSRRK